MCLDASSRPLANTRVRACRIDIATYALVPHRYRLLLLRASRIDHVRTDAQKTASLQSSTLLDAVDAAQTHRKHAPNSRPRPHKARRAGHGRHARRRLGRLLRERPQDRVSNVCFVDGDGARHPRVSLRREEATN